MIELGGGCQRCWFPVFFPSCTHSATPFFSTLKQAIHVCILIDSLHTAENWSNHFLSSFFCSTIVFCVRFSCIPKFCTFHMSLFKKKNILLALCFPARCHWSISLLILHRENVIKEKNITHLSLDFYQGYHDYIPQ